MGWFTNNILLCIHAANLLWIGRIFWLSWHSWTAGVPEFNYLSDAPLLMMLASTTVLHLARWRLVSRDPTPVVVLSAVELKVAMRKTAATMYGAVPYLIRMIPTVSVLEQQALKQRPIQQPSAAYTQTQLMRLLLGIDIVFMVHFICVPGLLFALYLGGFPSFAQTLASIWIFTPILICAWAGMLIYSSATVIFPMLIKHQT